MKHSVRIAHRILDACSRPSETDLARPLQRIRIAIEQHNLARRALLQSRARDRAADQADADDCDLLEDRGHMITCPGIL